MTTKRKYVVRHTKKAYAYTLSEAASAIGISNSSMSRFLQNGDIKPIDNKRPILIHGSDLQAFCNKQSKKCSIPCRIGELACLSCKKPYMLPEDALEFVWWTENKGIIKARCPKCGSKISQFIAKKSLGNFLTAVNRVRDKHEGLTLLGGEELKKQTNTREYNAGNERLKHQFFVYLVEAAQRSPKSLKTARLAIYRYETFLGFSSLTQFNKNKAVQYKKYLRESLAKRSGKPLSLYTLYQCLSVLIELFTWLSKEKGYKLKGIDYLTIGEKEKRIATAGNFKQFPRLHEIRKSLLKMPTSTDREIRNRAFLAFLALSGVRMNAAITLRIKHIVIKEGIVIQDPKEVGTKNGEKIVTRLFPIGHDILHIFEQYYFDLTNKKGFGPDDPLFPKMLTENKGNSVFKLVGYSREFMQDPAMFARIVKDAFASAGYMPFSPHRLRDMLVDEGKRGCKTPQEFKAWSRNLGHKSTRTTMDDYAQMDDHTQLSVINSMWDPESDKDIKDEMLKAIQKTILELLDRQGIVTGKSEERQKETEETYN